MTLPFSPPQTIPPLASHSTQKQLRLSSNAILWEMAVCQDFAHIAFGYNALQIGFIEQDYLHSNRCQKRHLADDQWHTWQSNPPFDALSDTWWQTLNTGERIAEEHSPHPNPRLCQWVDLTALPYEQQSLDLVVLPHTLELCLSPMALLKEVERCLVADGQLIIFGCHRRRFLGDYQHLSLSRLNDWLQLLGFSLEEGRFGFWHLDLERFISPSISKQLNTIGDRWLPSLAGLYAIRMKKKCLTTKRFGIKNLSKMGVLSALPQKSRKLQPTRDAHLG